MVLMTQYPDDSAKEVRGQKTEEEEKWEETNKMQCLILWPAWSFGGQSQMLW
jgi:hypothetical protein